MKKTLSYFLLLPMLSLAAPAIVAQTQDSRMMDRLESARQLYYNGSYYAAEKAFMELNGSDGDRIEIEAYKILCAIALDKVNVAGLVKVFCDKYPTSPQQDIVKWALGARYFDTGQYNECLSVLNQIRKNHLYSRQFSEFEFKKAYSNMRCGNFEDAGRGFDSVLSEPESRYTVPATYYRGYVYYYGKEFDKALSFFEKVRSGSRFEYMAIYYSVECRFMLKEYDSVIELGTRIFPDLEADLKNSVARILSETYFAKGDKEKAKEYMDFYTRGTGAMSRKDYYYAGLLSYGLNSFDAALEAFSHVVGTDDELSQNAYYYSANSRLKTRNKLSAIDDFKAAAGFDYDPVIKEDALFNFAKLSFDVNSDISQFENYLKAYPESGKEDIVNNYMAASFLSSKNYRAAVEALVKIKNPSREASANLQKAAFFSALQLIEDGGFRSAIPLLETARANGENNRELDNLVKYWLAECYFRNDRYQDAALLNQELLSDSSFRRSSEYSTALYNLAYDHFKANDFAAAETAFKNYIDNADFARRGFGRDARIRLADSYFMQKKYEDAATLYEDIHSGDYMTDDIYPAIQSAISYGLTGRSAKKIEILSGVVRTNRNSPLYPQALFELGCTYARDRNPDGASECFYTLLGMEKDSTFYARSLMELASLNVASRKYDKAISCYKTVISDTPYAPQVQDAIAGLENVYQKLNRPEDFLAYIDQIGMSGIKSESEKELMIFNSARQLFKAGRYPAAMNALQRYISQYPSGSKAVDATFYLAECLRSTGRYEAASDAYGQTMRMGGGQFLDEATLNFARINYDLKHFNKSIEAYDKAVESSKNDNVKRRAYEGRMRACFASGRYRDAIRDASLLIASAGVEQPQIREARFIMAKSYQVIGESGNAKSLLEELAKNPQDAFGAESQFILIQRAYDSGDFYAVEDRVKAFAEVASGQLYWLAKSFIVLGDSLVERDNITEALDIYEKLLSTYSPKDEGDDLLEQVMGRVAGLKSNRR